MSGGNKVVGSLSLKVWADTRGLGSHLRRDLRELEHELPDLDVGVELDRERLASEARHAVAEANALVDDVVIHTRLDKDGVARQLREFADQAEKSVQIKAKWDYATLAGMKKELAKLVKDRDVKVSFDYTSGLKDQLDGWHKGFADSLKRLTHARPVKMPVDPEIDFKSVQKVHGWLGHYFHKTPVEAEIHPGIDGKGLSAAFKAIHDKLALKAFGDPVKIPLELDDKGLVAAARRMAEEADRMDKIRKQVALDVRPNMDPEALNAGLKRLEKELVKHKFGKPVQIPVDVDKKAIPGLLKKVRKDLDRFEKVKLDVDAELAGKLDTDVLRAQLDRVKRELADQTANWELRPKVKIDENDLAGSARRLAREISERESIKMRIEAEYDPATMRRNIDELQHDLAHEWALAFKDLRNHGDIKIRPDLDTTGAWAKLKAFTKRASGEKIRLTPKVDASAIDRTMEAIKNKWLADHAKHYDIELKPHMSEAERLKLYHKLRKIKKDWDNTELDFKTVLDKSAHATTWARLKVLTRDRWVGIKPVIDNKAYIAAKETLAALSGYRMSKELWSRFWDSFKNIDKNLPKIFLLSSGMASAASAASQLGVSVAGVATGLVKLAAGGMLVFPALAASALTGILTLKNALSQTDKYAQYITNDIEHMKKQMADVFWAKAGKRVRQAWNMIFKEYNEGRKAISAAAGNWFGEMMKAVGEGFKGSLGPILKNMAKAFDVSAKGAKDVTTVMRVLLHTGSQYLPVMAGEVNKIAAAWAKWLSNAQQTGKLDSMIKTAGVNLKALLGTAMNLGKSMMVWGRIVESVVGPSLQNAQRITGNWLKMFSGNRFQNNFRTFVKNTSDGFKAMAKNMSVGFTNLSAILATRFSASLKVAATTAGKVLGQMFNGIAHSKKLWAGIADLFNGFGKAAEKLKPVWGNLADLVGVVATNLGRMAPVLAGVARVLSANLLASAQRLLPVLAQLSESLGPVMAQAISVLAPVVTTVAEVIGKLADALLRIPVVGQAAVATVLALIAAFKGFQVLSTVGTAISGAVAAFGEINRLRAFAAALKGGRGVTGALSAVADTAGLAGVAVAGFAGKTRTAGGMVRGMVSRVSGAKGVWGKFGAVVGTAGAALGAVPVVGWAAVGAVTAVAGGVYLANKAFSTHKRELADMQKRYNDYVKSMSGVRKAVSEINQALKDSAGAKALSSVGTPADKSGAAWISQARSARDYTESVKALGQALNSLGKQNPQAMLGAAAQAAREFQAQMSKGDATNAMRLMMSSSSALRDQLNSLLHTIGAAGTEQNRLAALTNLAAVQQRAAAMAALQHQGALNLVNGALGQAYQKLGYTANASKDLALAVAQGGQSFFDFAAKAKNGADLSAQAWVDGLKRQLAAHQEWQKNMEALTKAGVDQGVLAQLARMGSEGERLVSEFAKMPPEKAKQMLDEIKGAFDGAGASGQAALSQYWQGMINVSDQALAQAKQTILSGLGGMADAASVEAAKTPQALVEALQAGAGMSAQSAQALVAAAVAGLSQTDIANAARMKGDEAVNSLADALQAKQNLPRDRAVAIAQGVVQALQSGMTPAQLSQLGSSGIAGFASGLQTGQAPAANAAKGIKDATVSGLAGGAPQYNQEGKNAAGQYGSGAVAGLAQVPANLAGAVQNAASNISTDPFKQAGMQAGDAFFQAVTASMTMQGPMSITTVISGLFTGIDTTPATTAGQSVVQAFTTGLTMGGEGLAGAVQSLIAQLTTQLATAGLALNQSGMQAAQQYAMGVTTGAGAALTAGTQLANSAATGATNTAFMTAAGTQAGTQYTVGLRGSFGAVSAAGAGLSNAAAGGARGAGVAVTAAGTAAGTGYANAVRAQAGNAATAGRTLSNRAGSAANSGAYQVTNAGRAAGQGYVKAMQACAGGAAHAGRALSDRAGSAANSGAYQVTYAGRAAGQGFVNALYSQGGAAYSAGMYLGRMANAGLRATLRIHSPSRVMMETGMYAGEGFRVGLRDSGETVWKQSAQLGETALDALEGVNYADAGRKAGEDWAKNISRARAKAIESTMPTDGTGSEQTGGVTVNQYIQTAVVERDSDIASQGAAEARMIGGLV